MRYADLQTWCESEAGWLRQAVETLVRHESPSTDRDAVNRCGAALSAMLQGIGASVTQLPGVTRGDHLRAELGSGGPQVLLLGHIDTVWDVGQIDRMPLREENGRLYGPGVFDMKAGIAVALLAIRAVQALRAPVFERQRVVLLWTTDEEVGSGTSRAAIEAEALRSRAVLVLEPSLPGGAVKTRRKGCGEFELVVHGVEAHAGVDPGAGASAIHELARQIAALDALQDPGRGISVNVGVVSGGTRSNVVAGEARAWVDVRVERAADAALVEDRLRQLAPGTPRTRIELRGGFSRPPLENGPHVAALYEVARQVARALGRELEQGATGGGSDGNFTAALGVPTLDGLGPPGGGAHALDEHVLLAELPARAALVAGLLCRLAEGRLENGVVK